MSGMPFLPALLLSVSIIVLIAVTQWRRLHPFIAIVFVASAFGLAAGLSISLLGKAFGAGFSRAIYSPGLIIVGAALIGGIAETTTASDRLLARIEGWRSQWPWLGGLGANSLGANGLAAVLGLIAGIGTSPAAAFALLMPLLRPIGGKTAQQREGATVTLGLAISASHGLVVLTPIPIAAAKFDRPKDKATKISAIIRLRC